MKTVAQLSNSLKIYISKQLDIMSKNTPIISFINPIITRIIDKNFNKVTDFLDLISDNNGNIDIENILTDMINSVMSTQPFIFSTSFIGDVEIGGGYIKFNLPIVNKKLVLDATDLQTFKEMLINN